MGIFKAIFKAIDKLTAYEVTCKYCGECGMSDSLRGAIQILQERDKGCGRNCHDPVVTRRPD